MSSTNRANQKKNSPQVPSGGAKPLRRGNGNSNRVGQASQNVSTALPSPAGRAVNGNKKFYPNVPYPQTARYMRYLSNLPKTMNAVKAANSWINLNKNTIDPSCMYICDMCGISDFNICICHIDVTEKKNILGFSDELHANSKTYGKTSWFTNSTRFTMDKISYDCSGFDNAYIPNTQVDLAMYNFIKLNMSLKYSSLEDREEHVRKLCYKYLDMKKVDTTCLSTSEVNRILITRQKVRDQYEADVLLRENRPQEKKTMIRKLLNFLWACFHMLFSLLHFAVKSLVIVTLIYLALIIVLDPYYWREILQFVRWVLGLKR